jgi:L-threonylcarbamoyladenylate synthase
MLPSQSIRKLDLSNIGESIVDEAVRIIKGGGVILYPTDTIYGLGCNAFDVRAVERIYAIKKRPSHHPVLVLMNSVSAVEDLVEEIPVAVRQLLKVFWPGPVTFVFWAKRHLPRCIVSEDGKIGIRIPKHEFCKRLCGLSGVPVLSTSANISGQPQTVNIDILKKLFAMEVDLFIDAGDYTSGTVSTVVDVTGKEPVVLREGVISRDKIVSVLHRQEDLPTNP